MSELEAIVKEDMAWRYINMTRDTESEELRNKYQFFVEQILPHLSVYEDQLNRKRKGKIGFPLHFLWGFRRARGKFLHIRLSRSMPNISIASYRFRLYSVK